STAAAPTPAVVDPNVIDTIAADGQAQVVVVASGASLSTAKSAVAAAGGEVLLDLDIIEGFSATLTAEALEALLQVDGVRAVTIDAEVTLAHGSADNPPAPDDFYDETVAASPVQAKGYDGSGVGIAVIDTGVTEVPDLFGRLVGAVDFSGDGDDVDHFGHGTMIAGIAAGDGTASDGKFVGVAPGAHIIPVKIAGRNGAADVSHVLAAMQYVVSFKDDYNIRILNLSLGTDSTQPQALSPLNYAVERAWDSGIVVVVSGGNHGEDRKGRIPKPADDPLVITVGATDSNGTVDRGDDEVAAYSSRGPSIADGIEKPDIVAPGSHVVGTLAPDSMVDEEYPEAHIGEWYVQASGTSFAAGVVSGAAALLLEAHPDWTPNEVKGAIISTAAAGPVGERNVDGYGALDVHAAFKLTDPPVANQGVTRSTGLGLVSDDRGSYEIEIVVDGVLSLLTGDTTAQNELFDITEYTTTEWSTSQWYTSQWYTSQWYTSQWYTSQWYASQWYTSQWY
ncbi:MAG: S8 family serine peptidase, partial [Nitriliruptorales bacterium]|nr:S8 family serine peptidase [Nitriliruptorales bacterium]